MKDRVSWLLAALTMVAGAAFQNDATADENRMKTNVRRDGDRVWLEGVSGWSSGEKGSSVHAAQAAAMQAVGESTSYDDLLGISGLAFRMQLSKDGLCPSSPHSFCGFMCVSRSTQALPWKVRIFAVKPEQKEKVSEARRAVVESIDRGIPVQYGSEEDGLVVGYQKEGAEWICLHPNRDGGQKTFVETQWPWGLVVFTERKTNTLARKDLARGALEQAVTMASTRESGVYVVGFAAWTTYLQRLKDLEKQDEATRQAAMQGNAWIYECLAQYRASAARYLKSVAGEFAAEPARHLTQAASLYEKMAGQVLRDDTHEVTAIAPYPRSLKPGQSWSADVRKEEVHRLEAALRLEREAMAEIEAALRLIKAPGGAEPR